MSVTIVGCGDIGTRLAVLSLKAGEQVTGWVRTPQSVERLKDLGITGIQVDLDQSLKQRAALDAEQLYYFAPPPSVGVEDHRVAQLIDSLAGSVQPRKVVYLSTSGVYGDCQGAWVDETREPAPVADRSKRRLDAERRWRAWSEHSGQSLVILRVAGIYGPGKLPIERLRKGLPMVAEEDAPITNHIHSLDLVSIALCAMEKGSSGAIFNVCDGQPESMTRYFNRVADFLKLPRPPVISLDEAQRRLSPGMLSYLAESRRLSNSKMIDELGVELRYPDLDRGLPACLDHDGAL
jgi:nucleoside-diphosphate-sugar epimerase